MLKISKDEFCNCVKSIEVYMKDMEELNNAVRKVGSGVFTIDSADSMMFQLIKVLGELTNSEETDEYGNDIDYYLFEKCKTVRLNGTNYDINTPELLYDYLEAVDKAHEE